MYTLLIVNPVSGQGRAAREKRRLLELVSNMPHVHTETTSGPLDAVRLASEAAGKGFEQVIAAGGDGTISQVITGLGDSRLPLGIIPLGTANVLAHDLKIPSNDIGAALAVIREGRTRLVDVARAGDRRFILMAGFGFDAAVVESVSHKVKDVLGSVAYVSAAIEQLVKYTPTRFRLVFDEGPSYETEAFAVIIANCGTYAHDFKIAPEAVVDDGMLDVLIFESGPGATLQFIGQALDSFFQTRIPGLNTVYFKSAKVRVESDPPVKMQLDGDVCGESDIDIEVLPKSLRLIVPDSK